MELRRLREWRLRRALSQADLSALSGVGQANLSKIENGRQRARPSTTRRLAAALEVDPVALMEESDAEHHGNNDDEHDRERDQ